MKKSICFFTVMLVCLIGEASQPILQHRTDRSRHWGNQCFLTVDDRKPAEIEIASRLLL